MNQNRDPRGVPTGGQFTAQLHPEVDLALVAKSGPEAIRQWNADRKAEWENRFAHEFGIGVADEDRISIEEAQAKATVWYSGQNATYEFVSTGTITPRGFDAWARTHDEVGKLPEGSGWTEADAFEVRQIVNSMHREAWENNIVLDQDNFEDQTGLVDADEAWEAYSKTSEPLDKWWSRNRDDFEDHGGQELLFDRW